MVIELTSTRKIIGSVFQGADQIFGSDTFTMVFCCCAKMSDITTEVIDNSIRELLHVCDTNQELSAAKQLSDCGDYELISKDSAEADIAEILRALSFLSIDNDKITKDDDTVIARAQSLRSNGSGDLN